MTRKTTLTVHAGNEVRALEIAATFRSEWKNHHRRNNFEAELYGVIFTDRSPRLKFYAWGWDGHVRVVEQEIEA